MMGENRYRYPSVLVMAVLVALGVLAYLTTRGPSRSLDDLPGVSGNTKEGVDIEVGKPKN